MTEHENHNNRQRKKEQMHHEHTIKGSFLSDIIHIEKPWCTPEECWNKEKDQTRQSNNKPHPKQMSTNRQPKKETMKERSSTEKWEASAIEWKENPGIHATMGTARSIPGVSLHGDKKKHKEIRESERRRAQKNRTDQRTMQWRQRTSDIFTHQKINLTFFPSRSWMNFRKKSTLKRKEKQ